MRLFQTQKFMSVVIIYTKKNTFSGITACSITLFTPTFQYLYTDISVVSVTFRNSGSKESHTKKFILGLSPTLRTPSTHSYVLCPKRYDFCMASLSSLT